MLKVNLLTKAVLIVEQGMSKVKISKIYIELRSTMTIITTLNPRILACHSQYIFLSPMILIKREV